MNNDRDTCMDDREVGAVNDADNTDEQSLKTGDCNTEVVKEEENIPDTVEDETEENELKESEHSVLKISYCNTEVAIEEENTPDIVVEETQENKLKESENSADEAQLSTDGNTALRPSVNESNREDHKTDTSDYRPPIKIKMKELFERHERRPRKSARPQRVIKVIKTDTDIYGGDTDDEYWDNDKQTNDKKDPEYLSENCVNDMAQTQNISLEESLLSDVINKQACEKNDDADDAVDEFTKYANNLKKSYELRMAEKLCITTAKCLPAMKINQSSVATENCAQVNSSSIKVIGKKKNPRSKLKLKGGKVTRQRLDRRRPHGIAIPEPIICEGATGDEQVRMWQCDLCTKLCRNQASYISHYKACLDKVKTEGFSKEDGKFICMDCGKVYELKASLQRHMRYHLGVEKYKCPICEKQFTDSKSLRGHVFIHTGEKPYVCSVCGFPFRDKSTWSKHERRHGTEKPFECDTCQKRFFHGVDLRKHQKIHLTDKEYKCSQCDKQFYLIGALKRHERVHTGERPFFCSFCSKAFTDHTAVRCHERTHTNIRPFRCDACDMTFAFKNHLDRHQRSHGNGRPFKCEFCLLEFTERSTLVEHKSQHVGDTPYECTVCSETFSESSVMRIHRKTHVIEKSFSCPVCSKTFSRNYAMRRHVDKMHSGHQLEKTVKSKVSRKGITKQSKRREKRAVKNEVIGDQSENEVLVKEFPAVSMTKLGLCGGSDSALKTDKGSEEFMEPSEYSQPGSETFTVSSSVKHQVDVSEDNHLNDSRNSRVSDTEKFARNYWKQFGHQYTGDASNSKDGLLFVPPHKLFSGGFSGSYQPVSSQDPVRANLYNPIPNKPADSACGIGRLVENRDKPDLHNIHNDMVSHLEKFRPLESRASVSEPVPAYADYMYRRFGSSMEQETSTKGPTDKDGYSNEVTYNNDQNVNYSNNYHVPPSNHNVDAAHVNMALGKQHDSLEEMNKRSLFAENHFKPDWSGMFPSNTG